MIRTTVVVAGIIVTAVNYGDKPLKHMFNNGFMVTYYSADEP